MPRYLYTVDRTFFLILAKDGVRQAQDYLNTLAQEGTGRRLSHLGQNFIIMEEVCPDDPKRPIEIPIEPRPVPVPLMEEGPTPPPELDENPVPGS